MSPSISQVQEWQGPSFFRGLEISKMVRAQFQLGLGILKWAFKIETFFLFLHAASENQRLI